MCIRDRSRVFPHNLRHLFATAYYRAYRDIAKLADVLGHSSIETTRIYLLTSGAEHQRQLDRLGSVSYTHLGARVKITLRCNECKQRNYNTMKNKKNTPCLLYTSRCV